MSIGSPVIHPRSRWRRHAAAALLCGTIALACGASSASAAGLAIDKSVSTHQTSAATTVSSPSLTTAQPGELLIAFISSDGPSAGGTQTISKVSGGSLTWRLRRRANAQAGTAEIWQASAATTLNNVKVTATLGNGS